MDTLYNISVNFYTLIIRISAMFNPKAKLWLKGRKNIFPKLKNAIKENNNIVWMHCASLGEFEQGRTIIEGYKKKYPNHKILLTFFSPSGFEIQKDYHAVDWIFYLPADTKNNAKKFIAIIKPIKVIFIKYEFWFNYIKELKIQGIPFYSVGSVFRKTQIFFKHKWFAKQLQNVNHFFVQDIKSKDLLRSINILQSTVSGDPRFDSVLKNTVDMQDFSIIKMFSKKKETIICGSTWKGDEDLIIPFIQKHPNYNYIIAPHEMNHITSLRNKLDGLLLSKVNKTTIHNTNILIIDSIGMLAKIYRFGNVAYIGGGFSSGIHNILEPAVFGLPIVFGPNYKKSEEAKELIKLNGAKSVKNYLELQQAILGFKNFNINIPKNYINKKCGATKRILQTL